MYLSRYLPVYIYIYTFVCICILAEYTRVKLKEAPDISFKECSSVGDV